MNQIEAELQKQDKIKKNPNIPEKKVQIKKELIREKEREKEKHVFVCVQGWSFFFV